LNPGLALPGPYRREALAIAEHCQAQGMSWKRAYALACMASYGGDHNWTFQRTIANFTGYSVRLIQRAVCQAKRFGVLVSRRLRRGERPQGSDRPITCGGALRRFIGWGKPKSQALALRAKYALRWIWREQAVDQRRAREQDEIALAVREFRERGT
jgi:hypothetical protein